MAKMLQHILRDPVSHAIAWGVAMIYLLLFQIGSADLTLDTSIRAPSLIIADDWRELVLRVRAPFQFEAIAVVEAPFAVWLVSPGNIAIGIGLGLLTGVQVALVRIARQCASICGLSSGAGVLASLPGLLAGSACCAPMLFVLFGLQVTASLITLMGLLIPLAFILLGLGLFVTLRFAAKRCAGALENAPAF